MTGSKHQLILTIGALLLVLSGIAVLPAAAAPQADVSDWWMDMRIGPPLIDLFNDAAQERDIARVDHHSQVDQLRAIENGRKMVIFRSIAEAEEILPDIADQIDIIGYNLENSPATPADEKADPVSSVSAMRALADQYDLQLAFGPDHDFALSHGVDIAPLVDIFVLQIQRQQTNPRVVAEFVEPIVPQLRQANPDLQVSVQIRTEGEMSAVVQMVRQLDAQLDGISILTSPDTVENAIDLVFLLRPDLAGLLPGMGENESYLVLGAVALILIIGAFLARRSQSAPK